MARRYVNGIWVNALMTSFVILHRSSMLPPPEANSIIRSSWTVAIILAAWNPKRSLLVRQRNQLFGVESYLAGSHVTCGISLKHCGKLA